MLKQIYGRLLAEYGAQGWWPVTKKEKPEYSGGPKTEKQQLEVIFGAILTQNTSWKNAEKAIIELNRRRLIDIDRMLEIHADKLALAIKSSGYFNQKAKKLKNVAALLKKHPLKELERLEIKKLRLLLLSVEGIGPETADSIILYALRKPVFVVDTYTKRIFSRVGLIDKKRDYDDVQRFFHSKLKKDEKLFNEYHALIVEHAKRYCRKEPLCKNCIVNSFCKAAK